MTKEELAALTPEGTQFIEALSRIYVHYYLDLKEEETRRFQATPLGGYLWKVHHIVSEINQNIDDIKLAEILLLTYGPEYPQPQTTLNAADVIRYHYENYMLRTTKIKDLSLALINQVMRLELPKNIGLEAKLLKRLDPAYGQFEVIWEQMKKLTDHVQPYRNHLAHNGTVQSKNLALLFVHYKYGKVPESKLDAVRYQATMKGLQWDLVKKFTAQTKAYLIACDQVLTLVYLYLMQPFLDQMNLLVKPKRSV